MTSKTFFDTNILVYSGDHRVPDKRKIAQEITEEFLQKGKGVISTQVLQEYCSIELKKLQRDPLIIKQSIKLWQQFEVVSTTFAIINDALEIHLIYKFSFWDALIIAAALAARCNTLMTEDMQHGQTVQGLMIINPFKS